MDQQKIRPVAPARPGFRFSSAETSAGAAFAAFAPSPLRPFSPSCLPAPCSICPFFRFPPQFFFPRTPRCPVESKRLILERMRACLISPFDRGNVFRPAQSASRLPRCTRNSGGRASATDLRRSIGGFAQAMLRRSS